MKSGMTIKLLGLCDAACIDNFGFKTGRKCATVFCDFSKYDIPVGYFFSKVFDSSKVVVYSGTIELVAVTQQYLQPLELVPSGWKTICTFCFDDEGRGYPFDKLKKISDWYDSLDYLILSD